MRMFRPGLLCAPPGPSPCCAHRIVALPFFLPHDHLRWIFMMYCGHGIIQSTSLPRLHIFTPHLSYLRDEHGKLRAKVIQEIRGAARAGDALALPVLFA